MSVLTALPDAPALPLRRNRNFLLLISGQIVSSAGDQVQNFALLLVLMAMAGKTGQIGFVLGLNTASFLLFGVFAGALADRWDRRRTMIWCEIGRASATGGIAAAMSLGELHLAYLYVFAVITGVLSTLFQAASTAALPNVVGPGRLAQAMGTSQGAMNMMRVSGASLGAVVYSFSRFMPFVMNAVSFLVSALTLRLMRASFQESSDLSAPGQRSAGQMIGDIRAGLGWLWRQPVIRFLTLMQTADNLRYGSGYLVIIALAEGVRATPTEIGLVFTGAAIGALAGSLLAARAAARFRLGHIAVAMLWAEALIFPLYVLAPNALFLGVVAAAESVIAPVYWVAIGTYRLEVTPDQLRGRTSAAVQALTTGALSLGTMLGGTLIALLGARGATLALGGWLALLAISTTLNRQARTAGVDWAWRLADSGWRMAGLGGWPTRVGARHPGYRQPHGGCRRDRGWLGAERADRGGYPRPGRAERAGLRGWCHDWRRRPHGRADAAGIPARSMLGRAPARRRLAGAAHARARAVRPFLGPPGAAARAPVPRRVRRGPRPLGR
jgi:MFS family permease